MTSPLFEKIRSIAADVLEVRPDQITPQSSSESIETWDSVHHLNLVLALEQQFGIQFEPEEIDQMNRVARIQAVLESRVGQRS